MDAELSKTTVHLINHLREGENAALAVLALRSQERLEALACKMLNRFPGVKACEQTDNVVQNALLRLSRAPREVTPASIRKFDAFAAAMIRRKLLDMLRHHRRRPSQSLGESRSPGLDGDHEWRVRLARARRACVRLHKSVGSSLPVPS